MTRYDPLITLKQMLDFATEAVGLTENKSYDDVLMDRVLSLAIARLVELVGEVSTRLQDDFRAKYPQIPWRKIIGARNWLIHGYDLIDYEVMRLNC